MRGENPYQFKAYTRCGRDRPSDPATPARRMRKPGGLTSHLTNADAVARVGECGEHEGGAGTGQGL